MVRTRLTLSALLLPLALGMADVSAHAQTVSSAPTLVNYQGRLATSSGNPVPDGTYSIRFSLWDAASAGTEKWNQTLASVQVKNGTFAVLLNTNTAGLFNGNVWLETKIGSDAALTPRQQLVSVAYALKANSVPDGSIGTNSLGANAVTNPKIASDSLSLNKVSGGAMNSNGTSIGIGTPSSAYTLDVRGTQRPARFWDGTRSLVTFFGAAAGVNGVFFGTESAHPLVFQTTNAASGILDAAGNWGFGTLTPSARLHILGNAKMEGAGTFEFGAGVAGKYADAGKIGYQTFTPGTLDIVGAGTTATNRKVKVHAEGGAVFTGEVTATVVSITGGSDVAEPYNVAPVNGIKAIPGMLVAIDKEKIGQMRVVGKAYDTAVAGIISGANGINPGITLRQKGTIADGELPVASIGRVWCWCDADANGEIKAGDLLTSSDTVGHAMKATDRERRDGAVIGKAMSSLKSGKGLVLVLVSLK